MFINDIISKLCMECSFGDGLDYMGKIALYLCFLKRRSSSENVSTSCSDLYCRYLRWEATMSNSERVSLSVRFFGDIYTGLVVDDIIKKGESFINEMYLALCNRTLVRKPFQGTLIDYVDSWVNKNECMWLSYIM